MVCFFGFLTNDAVAGRTFNDLTQYPVFPFILRDYASATLDITSPSTFRDLSKPMGAQDEGRLAKFLEKYDNLTDMEDEVPYHYGSHYSNLGSVLHFLVRVEPFTQFFLEFQGGRSTSRTAPSTRSSRPGCSPPRTRAPTSRRFAGFFFDYVINSVFLAHPEFFYFPEFLCNINRFDMGVMQDDTRVGDVALPPWANGSARQFILRHRQALESQYVSENLHNLDQPDTYGLKQVPYCGDDRLY